MVILSKLNNITKDTLDFIFPDKNILLEKPQVKYKTNNIKRVQALCYGAEATGKTILGDYLVEIAYEKYGGQNVSAYISKDLDTLIEHGHDDKLINILFADDITRKEIPKEWLSRYFQLRHIIYNKYNRSQGLVFTLLGLHRFHGTPPDLRTNIDVLFLRSAPLNPWDKSVIKAFIGQDGIDTLNELDIKRRKGLNEYWNYSVVYYRGNVGLFEHKLPRGLYFIELIKKKSIPSPISFKDYFRFIRYIRVE